MCSPDNSSSMVPGKVIEYLTYFCSAPQPGAGVQEARLETESKNKAVLDAVYKQDSSHCANMFILW